MTMSNKKMSMAGVTQLKHHPASLLEESAAHAHNNKRKPRPSRASAHSRLSSSLSAQASSLVDDMNTSSSSGASTAPAVQEGSAADSD